MTPFIALVLGFNFFISMSLSLPANALSSNYYDQTCPNVVSAVSHVVKKAMQNDKTVPAALLRMHFHDCFVRVSVLKPLHIFAMLEKKS